MIFILESTLPCTLLVREFPFQRIAFAVVMLLLFYRQPHFPLRRHLQIIHTSLAKNPLNAVTCSKNQKYRPVVSQFGILEIN